MSQPSATLSDLAQRALALADAERWTGTFGVKGTATIDKNNGAILSYEMSSPKAFKPAAVAKVEKMTMKVACKPAPDGRTYVDSLAFNLKGSAMMQSFEQMESRKITNLKPLSKAGFGAP